MATSPSSPLTDKYASEYPLPGGVEQYFHTLVALLRHIRDSNVTLENLSEWIFSTFPNASGQIAVNGYLNTVGRMGLWALQEDQVRLTPEGTAVLEKADSAPEEAHRLLVDIKIRDFAGYDALLELLKEGATEFDAIHEGLKQALSVDWKSKNQTSFRVNWLRSLGYVEKDGRQYSLTPAGVVLANKLTSNHNAQQPSTPGQAAPTQVSRPDSRLVRDALAIADRLDKAAVAGGDGKECERATEEAFRFLGFETQLISGPGNPDVLATAPMGEKTYRVLLDAKSRGCGVVQQNDVNLPALNKQKGKVSADYCAVVGVDFASGNLQEFATEHKVRLITSGDLRELLIAHADSALILDVLRQLFEKGGSTDEGILTEILANAESRLEAMRLACKVYGAVRQYQDQEGAIDCDCLFYMLKGEYSLKAIRMTVEFLKSDLIGALAETEQGDRRSLYTRLAPSTLTNKLMQLTRTMDLTGPSG